MVNSRSDSDRSFGHESPNESDSIGLRIAQIADILGTRTNAASVAGISADQLANYIKGQSKPSFPAMQKLCAATGVSLDWLATGEGPMAPGEDQPYPARAVQPGHRPGVRVVPAVPGIEMVAADESVVVLPRLAVRLSAGAGSALAEENVIGYVFFARQWLREALGSADSKGLAIVGVIGNSMEPTIRQGDDVMVDTAVTRYFDNAIYAFVSDDLLVVKRLHREGDGLSVISDNPAYAPQTLSRADAEQLQIIGRVRWVGRLV